MIKNYLEVSFESKKIGLEITQTNCGRLGADAP